MINKALGYVMAILGIISLSASLFPEAKDYLEKSLGISMSQVPNSYLLIGGVVIILLGVFIVLKSGKRGGLIQALKEVPIFHGNKIVGYRRH